MLFRPYIVFFFTGKQMNLSKSILVITEDPKPTTNQMLELTTQNITSQTMQSLEQTIAATHIFFITPEKLMERRGFKDHANFRNGISCVVLINVSRFLKGLTIRYLRSDLCDVPFLAVTDLVDADIGGTLKGFFSANTNGVEWRLFF